MDHHGTASGELRLRGGTRVNRANGTGWLVVGGTSLRLELDVALQRVAGVPDIRHEDRAVTVIETRLAPPRFDTHVLVTSEVNNALFTVPARQRARLLDALQRARFDVHEHRTWIRMGFNLVDHPR